MFYRQGPHTSHQRLRPFSLKYDEVTFPVTSTDINPYELRYFQPLHELLQAGVPGKQFDLFQVKQKQEKMHGGSGEVEVEATIPNLSTSPRLQQESSVSQGMLPKGASKEAEMQYIPVRDAQEGLSYMMCLWFLWLGEETGDIVLKLGRMFGRWQDSAVFSCTESLIAYCRLNRIEFAQASRPSSTK